MPKRETRPTPEPPDPNKLAEAEMDALGGFKLAPLWESMRPCVCTICGCHVSRSTLTLHRSRCQ